MQTCGNDRFGETKSANSADLVPVPQAIRRSKPAAVGKFRQRSVQRLSFREGTAHMTDSATQV